MRLTMLYGWCSIRSLRRLAPRSSGWRRLVLSEDWTPQTLEENIFAISFNRVCLIFPSSGSLSSWRYVHRGVFNGSAALSESFWARRSAVGGRSLSFLRQGSAASSLAFLH